MDIIQTIFLAVVQGVTELLPISSSGHLLIVSKRIFSQELSTFYLASLHFGTTIAIILGYKDFFLKNIFNSKKIKLVFNIACATLPAMILGLLFKENIENVLRGEKVIAFMLFGVGLLMIVAENSKLIKKSKINKIEDITLLQSVVIGFGQALALIPGTSRSGSTTLVAMFLGIEKYNALKYSFILGIPILLGTLIHEILSTPNSTSLLLEPTTIIGITIAAITGYITIRILERFSKSNFLTVFGIYRILLAITILLTL